MERTAHAPTVHSVPWGTSLDAATGAAWEAVNAWQTPLLPTDTPAWWEIVRAHWPHERWRVVVLRQGETPIGVLPLHTRRGGDALLDYFAEDIPPLALHAGKEGQAWLALLEWLREGRHGPLALGLSRDPLRIRILHAAGELTGVGVHADPVTPVVYVPIPDTLPPRVRLRLEHVQAHAARDFPDLTVTFADTPADGATHLATLLALLRQRGRGLDPRVVSCYQALMGQTIRQGYGTVAVLQAGGRVAAVATVLHVPGQSVAYCRHLARGAFEPRYRMGACLLAALIDWLRSRGARLLHLGPAAGGYRHIVGGVSYPQWRLSLTPPTLYARVVRWLGYLGR
jgi:hypothetical protein